ncbi:MAG: hypothetical protein ACE1S7_07170 [Candidatus Tisiphia sp.]
MVIAKKPFSKRINIDLTDAIISKGGSSSSEQLHHENKNIKVTIRLSSKMINIIDNYLEKSISKKTRTCWVREAVEEKIERDISS